MIIKLIINDCHLIKIIMINVNLINYYLDSTPKLLFFKLRIIFVKIQHYLLFIFLCYLSLVILISLRILHHLHYIIH